MRPYKTSPLAIAAFSLMVVVAISAECTAQGMGRAGRMEIFAVGQVTSDDSTTGMGLTIELDDTAMGGVGLGYNFNDHINLNTAVYFGEIDITGTASPWYRVESDSSLWSWELNLDLNVLKTSFTPVLTAGLGFFSFDGDFDGFDFGETDFSYNVGVGLRWDVADHLLLKLLYKPTWTKLEDTDSSIRFDTVSLSIGYIF
jgi:opacity protein-like surface antigen